MLSFEYIDRLIKAYIFYFFDNRDVAQFGSAPALGAGCRGFESLHPDQFSACSSTG